MHSSKGTSYLDAGVNLTAANQIKERIKQIAGRSLLDNTLEGPGAFGGVIRPWPGSDNYLVASTDGVGTKTKIAHSISNLYTIGIDIVNHSVNDVLAMGGKPLFFLDYIGLNDVVAELVEQLLHGMADACLEAGCVLLGGETAIMPQTYIDSGYEVVGFMVGTATGTDIRQVAAVSAGDFLFGIPSSGLHTNGYSLARKVFQLEDRPKSLSVTVPNDGRTLAEALLEPHRSYLKEMQPYITNSTRPLAHITGGGLVGNVTRVMPQYLMAEIDPKSWDVPPIFNFIQKQGNIATAEMFTVFNMGIGMVGFLPEDEISMLTDIPGAIIIGKVRRAAGSGGTRADKTTRCIVKGV